MTGGISYYIWILQKDIHSFALQSLQIVSKFPVTSSYDFQKLSIAFGSSQIPNDEKNRFKFNSFFFGKC